MKSSLEGPESEEHEKKKNTNTNTNTTMTRAPANFFRKCEKFAKDKVIYGKEGLEYWNTAKERRNLRSFDMKTSPHRDAIFFSSRFMDRITQVSSSSLFSAKR